jgi:hypothetical protein
MSKGLAILFIALALGIGVAIGFVIGVAASEAGQALLSDLGEDEKKADLSNPTKVEHPGFAFEHPSNWTIDKEASEDPSHYLMLYTPGGSYLELTYEDELAEVKSDNDLIAENLQLNESRFEGYLDGAQRSEFDTYGKFKGKGVKIVGRSYGLRMIVRIFCYAKDEKTLTIVEEVYGMDSGLVQPGFDHIERTLVLR